MQGVSKMSAPELLTTGLLAFSIDIYYWSMFFFCDTMTTHFDMEYTLSNENSSSIKAVGEIKIQFTIIKDAVK